MKETNYIGLCSIRHNLTVPSSEHDASRPGSFGLNANRLTSCKWACGFDAINEKLGGVSRCLTSSSRNTRILLSPHAVAIKPVNGHLHIKYS